MSSFVKDYVKAKLNDCGGKLIDENGNPTDWYVYYGIRNPATGAIEYKKKRKGINYIPSVRERRKKAGILIEAIDEMLKEGRPISPPANLKQPVIETRTLIQELQDQHKRFVDKSNMAEPTMVFETCAVYKSAMNLFIAWLKKKKLDNLKPSEFTKQHAYAFSDYLIKEKNYKGVSYNNKKNYVSAYLGELAEREIIKENYFFKIKSLPVTPAHIVAFTEKELRRIKEHLIKINKPELLRFFHFILFGLMRGKGVTKIQLFDINTDKWVVLIYGNKSKTKYRYAPTIPIFMRAELKKLKKKYPGEYYLFSTELKPGRVPITRAWVTRLWLRHVKIELGINKNMYHGKHTGVTKAVNAGKSDRGILTQGGWKTERQFLTYKIQHGLITNEEFADMK